MEEVLHSVRVSAGTRLYYFDVRRDKSGQKYMAISEIHTDSNKCKKERKRIFIHGNAAEEFARAFGESIGHLMADGHANCQ